MRLSNFVSILHFTSLKAAFPDPPSQFEHMWVLKWQIQGEAFLQTPKVERLLAILLEIGVSIREAPTLKPSPSSVG